MNVESSHRKACYLIDTKVIITLLIVGSLMEQKIQSFSCGIGESEPLMVEESSQFLKQYLDFFGNMWKEQINRDQILRKLEKHAIKYSPGQYKPFSISIQRKSKNSEIVMLSVVWGQFEQCISIINYAGAKVFNSSIPNYRSLSKSILYQQKIKGKSIMFKSQCFESNRNRAISSTIKQLFIAKIASALQFGPYCHQDTGFDVFIYDNYVQFGMEKCFTFNEMAHNYRCDDLKQGLFLMHHLKMIHFDIKPENIMYSSKFHKFVIIDFNLSDITNFKVGMKVSVSFRGTINYCSPDFVHNFLLPNEARLIDPYYNDIYSLRESFNDMKQTKSLKSACVQDLEDNDDDQQDQFQLLIVKRWLFWGEWKAIDNYFRAFQIPNSIYNSLATFLLELDITDNLEHFYNNCIPKRFKEAYEMIEFQYLIRRRWFISIGVKQVMNERRQQFEDRFEFINPEEDSKLIQLSKVEAINYLLNEDKFVNSRVTYFSLFLKYVSFCENKFQVDAKERQQIGSKCNQFITKHCSSEPQFEHSSASQLEVAIVQIVGWVTPLLKDKQQSERMENEELVKDVVWKLLPFLFILDLGTVQQNLNWFHLIVSSLEVKQDKAYTLLTLKNLNIWNRNRIGRKKGQSRFQVVSLVKQFVTEQLITMRSQSLPDLQKIIEFALRINLNQTYEQCEISYHGPHRRLKQMVKLESLDRFLEYSTFDLKAIETIYNMFHSGENYEIAEHFCFSLFDRYRIMGKNEFSHFVYQTFSRNLKDKQLEKQFRIYYENLSQAVLSPGNLFAQIKLVGRFLAQLEDEDLILSHSFVAKVDDIEECLLNERESFSCQNFFRMQVQFSQVKSRLEGLIINYQDYKQIGSCLKIHECFNIQSQFDLYIFNLEAYQDLESYRSFLFELRKRNQYSRCNFCENSIECFIIVCQQSWSLMLLPQNTHSIIQKLRFDFQSIIQKSEIQKASIINKQLFEKVSFHFLLNFACFCTQSKQYELEYHGLKRLYLQIKYLRLQRNVSYFWLYLSIKQRSRLFLNLTMQILFEESPMQFLTFLKYLAEYLDKNFSQKIFNIILLSLKAMILRVSPHNQLVMQSLVKTEARSNTNLPNLFSIFFYIFAVITQDDADRKAAFYRLTLCLSLLSSKLVSYYSTQIHRYFTLRLRLMGGEQLRQHFFLNNRLVKLLILTSSFQLIKHRKYPKFRNKPSTMLVSKLNKIEGPYRLKGNPPSLFYFQMKGTSTNKK